MGSEMCIRDSTKTVCACFAVLRQLRNVRPSFPRSILQSLVTSLVLTRLDYGNGNLAGIPLYLLKRLQSLMNSAARLVFSSSRYNHITPLLHQLHWLKARERTDFKLILLVYKCQHGATPSYLTDELSQPVSRLRGSMSSAFLLFTVADCPRYTRLSVTEPFRSPQLAFGTVCRSMSRLHHHCMFSAAPEDTPL